MAPRPCASMPQLFICPLSSPLFAMRADREYFLDPLAWVGGVAKDSSWILLVVHIHPQWQGSKAVCSLWAFHPATSVVAAHMAIQAHHNGALASLRCHRDRGICETFRSGISGQQRLQNIYSGRLCGSETFSQRPWGCYEEETQDGAEQHASPKRGSWLCFGMRFQPSFSVLGVPFCCSRIQRPDGIADTSMTASTRRCSHAFVALFPSWTSTFWSIGHTTRKKISIGGGDQRHQVAEDNVDILLVSEDESYTTIIRGNFDNHLEDLTPCDEPFESANTGLVVWLAGIFEVYIALPWPVMKTLDSQPLSILPHHSSPVACRPLYVAIRPPSSSIPFLTTAEGPSHCPCGLVMCVRHMVWTPVISVCDGSGCSTCQPVLDILHGLDWGNARAVIVSALDGTWCRPAIWQMQTVEDLGGEDLYVANLDHARRSEQGSSLDALKDRQLPQGHMRGAPNPRTTP
ncbi:uncharacterized protein J3D65DRAFT_696696 [Phyllosticta citribraziliensis]|uniref:Uncharacterized protein n=1 Tax=Phyllosticta citribraziliensis TaxID=989973 RepID=A0ABR1LQ52_9PEZI